MAAAMALELGAVDEVDGAHHAEERPEIVPPPLFAHEKKHERHEHADGDHFLDDLELRHVEPRGGADPVGRHGDHVFHERDQPADDDDGDKRPRARAGLLEAQVPIPGESHEEVAGDEHRHRNQGAEGTRKFGEVHDRSYFKMSASETAASVTTVNTTNSEKMRKWWRQCTARANSATVA